MHKDIVSRINNARFSPSSKDDEAMQAFLELALKKHNDAYVDRPG